MTHEEKNIGGGAEHPGSDEQKISEMLSGLNRVEAPKDFDFHLKARIANARPEKYRKPNLFPILKYAAPLALFLVVGAGIVAKSSYDTWQAPSVAAVPVKSEPATSLVEPPVPANPPASTATPEIRVEDPLPERAAGPILASRPKVERAARRDPVPAVGSEPRIMTRDSTVRAAPTPIFAPGMGNTNTVVRDEPGEMAPKPLPIREALLNMGIHAELDGKTWQVKSVESGRFAHQIGMKAGDRVESIDGRAIDAETVFKDGSFKARTVRVRRSGAAVDLKMPKPE